MRKVVVQCDGIQQQQLKTSSNTLNTIMQPGVRTYLELRSFIEDSIKSFEAGDGEDATHQRNIAEQIARLPQIMTY